MRRLCVIFWVKWKQRKNESGQLLTIFWVRTFLLWKKNAMFELKSGKLRFEKSKRNIKIGTCFRDFDHWILLIDHFWHQRSRHPVVKSDSRSLLYLKVWTFILRAVAISVRFNNRLSRNQMIELKSVELKISGTISFGRKILLMLISRRIKFRIQIHWFI